MGFGNLKDKPEGYLSGRSVEEVGSQRTYVRGPAGVSVRDRQSGGQKQHGVARRFDGAPACCRRRGCCS